MTTKTYPLSPAVGIVILTWNGLDYTQRCLKTLLETLKHYEPGKIEVVVVDNASTDGTVEYLRSLRPRIKLIENPQNLGFSKANNLAIKALPKDFDVVLLNNDMELHQEDWLYRLQKCAYQAPDIGLVGCRLVSGTGLLMHAGTYMPLETLWGQQIGGGEKDINQYPFSREVEGVVFACVYLKRQTLQEVGLLDEDYFAYFEDTDYCFRAKEKGYRVFYCGEVNLVHYQNVSTSVNKVQHNKIFLQSQKIFKKKWLPKLKKLKYFTKVDWHSIFNFENGYAITSREIALALDRQGVEVCYRYVYGPGTPFPLPEPPHSPHYMVNIMRERPFGRAKVQVVYAQGDVFARNNGRYRVGYTMLETDRIPEEWVRQANQMDEVWVPSRFNVETFRESGVKRPIRVMPLGVDPNYFHPRIKSYPVEEAFVFLSIFEWGERKAPELLLKAFNDEFSAKEDVVLVVKTFNRDPGVDVQQQIRDLNLRSSGGQIIVSLNEIVPRYQLGALYRSCDCFVLPTRGEGWGMPILEAMACGVPVIATYWSAQTEFMTPENSFPLEVEKLVPARAKCPYYQGFKWAEPSYEHLRYLLRYVYENREKAREVGQRAAQEVAEKWTWDHTAKRIIERLEQIGN